MSADRDVTSVNPVRNPVRRATTRDIGELTRLRAQMLAAMDVDTESDLGWRQRCHERLAQLMGRGSFAAYVVDAPGGGLAACGLGWVDLRLPSPGTDGLVGYIANVSTDPGHRRRGHARAVVAELMSWFASQGVDRVELHATEEAEGLYTGVGFSAPRWPALRWHAPGR